MSFLINSPQIFTLLPLSHSNRSFQNYPNYIQFPHGRAKTIIRIMTSNPSNYDNTNENNNGFVQNILVMRHGDRMDNCVKDWVKTVETRKWDPPLYETGFERAFNVGKELKTQLEFPIHRVFVSPFLRCVQTAGEVIKGLCCQENGFDFSKVKVSIEFGLCEMLNREAIRPDLAPEDRKFDFNISELEAMLPAGTVDHSVEKIWPEMPHWEEKVSETRSRYQEIIQRLADKYPRENLLLVTHGEGVGTSVSTLLKYAIVHQVDYCAYSHAERHITFQETGSFNATSFELLAACNIHYIYDTPGPFGV